jgi:hypothetical protein
MSVFTKNFCSSSSDFFTPTTLVPLLIKTLVPWVLYYSLPTYSSHPRLQLLSSTVEYNVVYTHYYLLIPVYHSFCSLSWNYTPKHNEYIFFISFDLISIQQTWLNIFHLKAFSLDFHNSSLLVFFLLFLFLLASPLPSQVFCSLSSSIFLSFLLF